MPFLPASRRAVPRRGVLLLALAATAALSAGVVHAQAAYPSKPIRLIVPFLRAAART